MLPKLFDRDVQYFMDTGSSKIIFPPKYCSIMCHTTKTLYDASQTSSLLNVKVITPCLNYTRALQVGYRNFTQTVFLFCYKIILTYNTIFLGRTAWKIYPSPRFREQQFGKHKHTKLVSNVKC